MAILLVDFYFEISNVNNIFNEMVLLQTVIFFFKIVIIMIILTKYVVL